MVASGSFALLSTRPIPSYPRSSASLPVRSSQPSAQPTHDLSRHGKHRPLWVWWHLLSLDAATVAVAWCWFFGFVFHVRYLPATLPTLALGTWCVYVADRLLDGVRSTDTSTLRDRHWFYLRHRRAFLAAWAAAALPLAWLMLFRVDMRVRADDIVLSLIGVAYFLLVHHRSAPHSRPTWRQTLPDIPIRLSKEVAVGFLFAIATAVPAWARLHHHRAGFLAAVFALGALCWLNCVAIQTWEDADASREVVHTILSGADGPVSKLRPNSLTKFLGAHLTAFAASVGLLALFLGLSAFGAPARPLFLSVAASAVLFLALIHIQRRIRTLTLRIAADAALLTPLLFLLRLR